MFMAHAKSIENILDELDVNPANGLAEEEALARLEKYGLNRLRFRKKKTVFQMFLAQLNDWLIYILFAAVFITLFLQEYIDSIIIIAVIILNAILGVFQEIKAGNAIEALQKMSSPKSLVRRGGITREIDSELVVPGDILILDAGRFVSADIRLIETADIRIEESVLTGESVASEKDASLILDPDTPVGDRENLAFMTSIVTAGRGTGVVIKTGMDTEVGKIAGIIEGQEETKTPLEIRLSELGKTLGKAAVGMCLFIFIISLFQGRNLAEMFLVSVSLAVAAIPEGLAAIVAVVLSIGVTGMSKRNAIIRRLPAVETLGSVNIICSDKTGTLTQNKMTVVRYFTMGGEIAVEHAGQVTLQDDAGMLAQTMILCSDATLEKGQKTGDPTETALLQFGDDLGIDRKRLNELNRRVSEFPFDSDRKLMSTLTGSGGKFRVNTKGAVDSLLIKATHVLVEGKRVPITEGHRNRFRQAMESMSWQALRTLGAAYREVDSIIPPQEMEKELTLIGIAGIIDPPRSEVRASIKSARDAGIKTVMITGDHKNTAFAIAKSLDIAENIDQAVTGQEIDEMGKEELRDRILEYSIFARVSPEHKVKIVHALRARGKIVSMTGDGVNDAPSLQAADIGVAMGITGTDVAKNASDMILTDDNFATIVTAVEQGRNIYNNIKKSVIFLLASNLGEVTAIFSAILVGWEAPLLATQILWINLLTDSLPAVALGMDPGDPDVMKERPRSPGESFFAGGAGFNVVSGGILIGLITLLAFWYGYLIHGYTPFNSQVPSGVVDYARTMAFMTIISSQLFYSLSFRHDRKSIFTIGIFSNKYLIGAISTAMVLQLLVINIPALQNAFRLKMLDIKDWIIMLAAGLIPLAFREVLKLLKKEHGQGFTLTDKITR
ncbi:MAG: cation-translocating P-type ATPase [Deltaproteobacteria bacterium]|nr:cation-translocating P-type ATPase [Deltaproteobacteria bacterium]